MLQLLSSGVPKGGLLSEGLHDINFLTNRITRVM